MLHFIRKNKWTVFSSVLLLCVLIGLCTIGIRICYGGSENTLIVYFSRAGNTDFNDDVDAVSSASLNRERNGKLVGNSEQIALKLQRYLGGDLFSIKGAEQYPEDYEETVDQASDELGGNVRPALATHVENMEHYDRIILIYPIWWGTAPMPVFTFLEEYDFSGKEILPVATHKGSLLGNSVDDIRFLIPEAKVYMGIPISGSASNYFEWLPVMLIAGIILLFAGRWLRKRKYNTTRIKSLCYGVTGFGAILIVFVIIRVFI